MQTTPLPTMRFHVNKKLNKFCHLSVLYVECMPSTPAGGVLSNFNYLNRYAELKRDEIQDTLRKERVLSASEWFSYARALIRGPSGNHDDEPQTRLRNILNESDNAFDEIWTETETRLVKYKEQFITDWARAHDRVLSNLAELAKEKWATEEIDVAFVDCLNGGFAWQDSIALVPFPENDVEKKLLTHELSELITPQSMIVRKLRSYGLNVGLVHTIVDLIAYFSVKDLLENPERKGIKPNPNYYPAVGELFPFFESYSKNPSSYDDFETLIQDAFSEIKAPTH